MKALRVIQFGLGPIGRATAREILNRPGLKLVGAVDVDPSLVGKDLGEVIGLGKPLGIKVVDRLEQIRQRVDVATHCTSSFLKQVKGQLEQLFERGIRVVSSTEELLFPWLQHPALAQRLDRLARQKGVCCLGTGINPGFILDTWALFMTGAVQHVQRITATRYLDAAKRRGPLQKKVGSGLTVQEFRAKARAGDIGHIGLPESLALVASGLGWQLDRVERTLQPMIASRRIRTRFFDIPRGRVSGIWETMVGYRRGEPLIQLDLRMYCGCPRSFDRIEIKGTPNITAEVKGGYHGDVCTAATLVNNIASVYEAEPGLKTMLDLPVPRWNPGAYRVEVYNYSAIRHSYPDPTR